MIRVTKPFMPPIKEYNKFLGGIWEREWITNNGPLVQQLEQELTEYLDVDNLLFLGNGTIALQIAIKALGLGGENESAQDLRNVKKQERYEEKEIL